MSKLARMSVAERRQMIDDFLAELVSDPDFRQRVRQVTDVSVRIEASDRLRDWLGWVHENAVAAVLRGCPPGSAEAAQVVNRILEPVAGEHPLSRAELIAGLDAFTDPRIAVPEVPGHAGFPRFPRSWSRPVAAASRARASPVRYE